MKTVILLVHPNIEASRYNKALKEEAEKANFEIRELYKLYPDGKIDVAAEKQVLEAADRVVLQFPIRWYSSPSLLKQWLDDVLTYGWAYGNGGNKLEGKELVLAVSAGANETTYGRDNFYVYTVPELLRPFQATARLIKMQYARPFVTMNSMALEPEQYAERAKDYVAYISKEEKLPIFEDLEI